MYLTRVLDPDRYGKMQKKSVQCSVLWKIVGSNREIELYWRDVSPISKKNVPI